MEYYQEITLLPCAEVSLAFLWTKVFTQLHIAFADEKIKADITPMPFHFPNTGKQVWEKKSVSLRKHKNWKDSTYPKYWDASLIMCTVQA